MPLAHNDNRSVGQIHLVIARHKSAEPRPMSRNLKVQPNRAALEQLKHWQDNRCSPPQTAERASAGWVP